MNAYILPRFSVDCDLAVKNRKTAEKIVAMLKEAGFKEREEAKKMYSGKFLSFQKSSGERTTFDILIEEVFDRKTGTRISAETIFENSRKRIIYGKGSPTKIESRVADPELLLIMKAISSRKSDIRDVFMLNSIKLDKKKIIELKKKVGMPKESVKTIKETIQSKQFKDALAGVYGNIQEKTFQATLKKTLKTLKELEK